MASRPSERLVIGWREWIALPELGIDAIKVKTDTGARTSALHADALQRFVSRGVPMVSFVVHPMQRNRDGEVHCEAEMIDERLVRSSHGDQQLRPVIRTSILVLGASWDIEITLTRRDVMGFRMLLGREAMRKHLFIDPGHSYLGNASPYKRKKKKKKRSSKLTGSE